MMVPFNDSIVPLTGEINPGWIDTEYGDADQLTFGAYTNKMTLTQGLLWQYTRSEGVYRCPGQQQVATYEVGVLKMFTMTPVRSFTISEGFHSL